MPFIALDDVELPGDILFKLPRLVVLAIEAEAHDRVRRVPVPSVVDVQPAEQRLVAGKELAQGVKQQALAEAAWAGEEVVSPLTNKLFDQGGLVNVVAIVLLKRPEGLYSDGEVLALHGQIHAKTSKIISRKGVQTPLNKLKAEGGSRGHRDEGISKKLRAHGNDIARFASEHNAK